MLTVKHLAVPLTNKAERNHETYKMLYTSCADHIRRKNEVGIHQTTCHIPAIVPR